MTRNPALDPRLQGLVESMQPTPTYYAPSRQQLMAALSSPGARARHLAETSWLEGLDNTDLGPLEGLRVQSMSCVSQPDVNTINLSHVRPDTDEVLPCVYYIHGGGMARHSCFSGVFRSWSRLLAHQGVA